MAKISKEQVALIEERIQEVYAEFERKGLDVENTLSMLREAFELNDRIASAARAFRWRLFWQSKLRLCGSSDVGLVASSDIVVKGNLTDDHIDTALREVMRRDPRTVWASS